LPLARYRKTKVTFSMPDFKVKKLLFFDKILQYHGNNCNF